MSDTGSSQHRAVPIGEIAEPPFVRLPELRTLFAERAKRFTALSVGHDLGKYLRFLAGLCEAQHQVLDGLPEPEQVSPEAAERARAHAMPPLDAARFTPDETYETTLRRLLELAAAIDMPEPARAALVAVAEREDVRARVTQSALSTSPPVEDRAEIVFAAAALQVHFARRAARLDPDRLVSVGTGVCPACGARPSASTIVTWRPAENTRFCTCWLCATMWHEVRIKCMVCSSTKGISYQEVEGTGGAVKAETCESCNSYVKVLHQAKVREIDSIADDVATMGLDLLVREAGFSRGAVNPFLLGY